MRQKKRWIQTFAVAALILVALVSRAAPSMPEPFKDGDRVCFVGDSITHGGRYHAFIVLFYATRFPDRQITTFNCGISGDSAAGATRRFDGDIGVHSPTVATIMLGMNDVSRGLYGKENPDEGILGRRQTAIDHHSASMRALTEKLRALDARIIFITPSIYDQTSTMATQNLFGVNDALGICAGKARALAQEFGGTVVDFHGAMSRINAEYQKPNPALTIVGKDRVHPGTMGHLVMAYLFLKAQGVSPCVSGTVIDAGKGVVAEALNVTVTELSTTADQIAFVSLEKALPFPIPAGADEALTLVPFMQDLNQQMLTVRGLPEGTFELSIDDAVVGDYSADKLAAGINLAANPKTPQYEQAKIVATANDKRHSLIAGKLRGFVKTELYLKGVKDLDMTDFEAVKEILNARVEKMRQAGSPYTRYYEGQTKMYIAEKAKEPDYIRQAEEAAQTMRSANRPTSHHFVLRRKP